MTGTLPGPPLRAISLNIGGVNIYRNARAKVNLTYLAPWVPEAQLFCGLGYGMTVDKPDATPFLLHLGLRHPEVVARPLPWNVRGPVEKEYLRQWRAREWHGWLRERFRFPFPALVAMPPVGEPVLKQVTGLVPSTPQQARDFGIYLEVPLGREMVVAGATLVTPVDVTSSNRLALAEYQAYRDREGPPPGTRGQPLYTRVR